eukprot:jgi/Astpho2/8480/fgenesh1_pg.00125_%23_4_t
MSAPTGPFAASVVDLEYTSTGGPIKRKDLSSQHHLVARLFFPASKDSVGSGCFRARRQTWLPHWYYATGKRLAEGCCMMSCFAQFLFFWAKGFKGWAARKALAPVIYGFGKTQPINTFKHLPVAEGTPPFPVVFFSHGIGGTRTTYSAICAELTSQGYVVCMLEHADGTAAATKLAYGAGWLFYEGWGTEEVRMSQTRYRMGEVLTAHKLLSSMSAGETVRGLKLSSRHSAAELLKGRLDMTAVALAGHSYGGATVSALCAQEPLFKCTIALDPWWGALLADQDVLMRWRTPSPLLIMGSHTWNTPNEKGELKCGGPRQDQILEAARHRSSQEAGSIGSSGGGAVLLVLKGSSHDSFTDVMPLFAKRFSWLLKKIGFSGDMEPVLGLNLITRSMLAFLNRHLPLTPDQRQLFHDKPYPTLNSKHGQRPDKAADISATAGQVAAVVAEAEGSALTDGVLKIQLQQGERSCYPYVTPDEQQVFEHVAADHIAILKNSPGPTQAQDGGLYGFLIDRQIKDIADLSSAIWYDFQLEGSPQELQLFLDGFALLRTHSMSLLRGGELVEGLLNRWDFNRARRGAAAAGGASKKSTNKGEVDLPAAAAAAGAAGEQPAQPQRLTGGKRKHVAGSTETAEPAAEQPAFEAAGDPGAGPHISAGMATFAAKTPDFPERPDEDGFLCLFQSWSGEETCLWATSTRHSGSTLLKAGEEVLWHDEFEDDVVYTLFDGKGGARMINFEQASTLLEEGGSYYLVDGAKPKANKRIKFKLSLVAHSYKPDRFKGYLRQMSIVFETALCMDPWTPTDILKVQERLHVVLVASPGRFLSPQALTQWLMLRELWSISSDFTTWDITFRSNEICRRLAEQMMRRFGEQQRAFLSASDDQPLKLLAERLGARLDEVAHSAAEGREASSAEEQDHAGCTVQGRPARLAAGALAAGLTGARTDAGRRASLPAGAASPAAVLLAAAALPLWGPGVEQAAKLLHQHAADRGDLPMQTAEQEGKFSLRALQGTEGPVTSLERVTQCKDSGVPALRSFAQQPPQLERGSPGTEGCGVLMRARTGILPPILWRMWQAQHETGLQELLLSDAEAAQVAEKDACEGAAVSKRLLPRFPSLERLRLSSQCASLDSPRFLPSPPPLQQQLGFDAAEAGPGSASRDSSSSQFSPRLAASHQGQLRELQRLSRVGTPQGLQLQAQWQCSHPALAPFQPVAALPTAEEPSDLGQERQQEWTPRVHLCSRCWGAIGSCLKRYCRCCCFLPAPDLTED